MVQRFNRGEAGIDAVRVLMTTTKAIKQCEDDWQAAVACLEALRHCKRRGRAGAMERVEPNVIVFSAAISACGNAGQVVKARELFEEMKQRGLSPNLITYHALISAYRHDRQPGKARELLEEMLSQGLAPNIITCNLLISAYVDAGQPDEALKWFKEMRSRGISPDAITYEALLPAYVKAGEPGEALEWFEGMRSQGLSPIITYTAVISVLERAGMHDKVSELLGKGIDEGVFKPTLGLDRRLDLLNLHTSAVLGQAAGGPANERDAGVAGPVAKGIFRHLLGQKVISHKTKFVVGKHGANAVRNAIEDCMKEQNWTPRHPLDRKGNVLLGALEAAVLPLRPAAPSGTGTSSLNPNAAAFTPSWLTPGPAASGGTGTRPPLPLAAAPQSPSAAQPGPVPRLGEESRAPHPHTSGGSASRS